MTSARNGSPAGLFDLGDLTFEEKQGIGPDGSLFEGSEGEEEELQTRPSPDMFETSFFPDDCGPDDPPVPGNNALTDDCGPGTPPLPGTQLFIDDCGPGDPLPDVGDKGSTFELFL